MSDKELAIRKVVLTNKPTLLLCSDKKNQESTRVILYHLKRKMLSKGEAETIGITKFSHEGVLFIKIFKRPTQTLYELDENGIPVLSEIPPEEDKDLQRQIMLMRKDGVEEEEIQKVIDEAKGEKSPSPNPPEDSADENRGIDLKPEAILTEKEEMKKMLEEEEDEDNSKGKN
ncbi:MAG: hypothetical protein GY714_19905 [Desulfobacterales bacterium]|nr:hypothetical protein [Desulfobacterales bacterium]